MALEEDIDFEWEITNVGKENTPAFQYTILLSLDSVPDSDDPILTDLAHPDQSFPPLAPGSSATQSSRIRITQRDLGALVGQSTRFEDFVARQPYMLVLPEPQRLSPPGKLKE